METENIYLTRKVLFEKAPFFVQAIYSNKIFKVRYGKIEDISKENLNKKDYKNLIDSGFYTITEGPFKGKKVSMLFFKRINNGN